VGSIIITWSQIVCGVCQWKNFENRSIIDKDIDKSKVARFLAHPVDMPSNISTTHISVLTFLVHLVTACAAATSSCISDVPSQWEGQNFDPPQLPHFSTDLNETRNQERYPGYDPTSKIWLMWDDGKGVCVGRAFPVTFYVPSFFCILAHAYRSHQKTYHDRLWLKTRVSA